MKPEEFLNSLRKAGYEHTDWIVKVYEDMLLWRSGLILVMFELEIDEMVISDSVKETLQGVASEVAISVTVSDNEDGNRIVRLNYVEPDEEDLPGLDVFEDFLNNES